MNLYLRKVTDITGEFLVEAYQRGYRWTAEEITFLLEDIYESGPQVYCLQPVVVKPLDDDRYELIDGQQRLTTLYLIMRYLRNLVDCKYTIEYTTRKESRKLLEEIGTDTCNHQDLQNIDALFICKAYKCIAEWFDADKRRMIAFAQKLQNVSVIWYEVDAVEDSVSIFTRLNIGKISLTNAELVKALFMSRGKNGNSFGIGEKEQNEIALTWDQMEKGLHEADFWAFITNEKAEEYPIRMELLFDMMVDKPSDASSYYTFNHFYQKFKEHTLPADDKLAMWETVVRYYQQLQEWFADFDMYHRIGYLVANGTQVKDLLQKALDENAHPRKTVFRDYVIEQIRDSVRFKTKDGEIIDYADLNYEEHPRLIRTLLLLFNVETHRQSRNADNRFPFHCYKRERAWSLEHIHAQNSERLHTNRQWKDWLEYHILSIKQLKKETIDEQKQGELQQLITEMEEIVEHIEMEKYRGSVKDEFTRVSDKVVKVLTDEADSTQMHSLSNMALLTVAENAAFNDSTFDAKRLKLIEMDRKNEVYIPICTKYVFLKYYSTSDTKLHFWSDEDRRCYISAINEVLYSHKDENTEVKLIHSFIRYENK